MTGESALQHLLAVYGRPITVDGILGPASAVAFNSLESSARDIVSAFSARILSYRKPDLFAKIDVDQWIKEAAGSLPGVADYLQLMVKHENRVSSKGVFVEYEGPFKGIAQFNRRTWVSLGGPEWEQVIDPVVSLKQAVKLYLSNKGVFSSHFGDAEYTKEIAYLYHNQGGSAASEYLRTGNLVYPKQSAKAVELFKEIVATV
jgi:hypothetical protein